MHVRARVQHSMMLYAPSCTRGRDTCVESSVTQYAIVAQHAREGVDMQRANAEMLDLAA
jgi:hypothetical protein